SEAASASVAAGTSETPGASVGPAESAAGSARSRDLAALPALHAEQAAALAAIDAAPGGFPTFLLPGGPGSGTTEVYLRAAAASVERGSGVLLLVPEIGLTHQLVVEAARRFPGRIAVLHSGLSEGERLAAWRDVASGRIPVVVGARSGVFAPLRRLGL